MRLLLAENKYSKTKEITLANQVYSIAAVYPDTIFTKGKNSDAYQQILMVFFLPLAGALLHTAMVTNMILKLLESFWLYNTGLIMIYMAATSTVFTLAYIAVYRLTEKTYYRIVKW